jgi:hypothetical protein
MKCPAGQQQRGQSSKTAKGKLGRRAKVNADNCSWLRVGIGNCRRQHFKFGALPTATAKEKGCYRFENWKLFRAPLRPYFLRSFMRLSRVR